MHTTEPFIQIIAAALQLPDFLVHQADPACDDGPLTIERHERIRRHWLAAGCIPTDLVVKLVAAVADSLRIRLWQSVTGSESMPASDVPRRSNASFAQQESVSAAHLERKWKINAVHEDVMLEWLMTCPARLLQLADHWHESIMRGERTGAAASGQCNDDPSSATWALVQTTGTSFRQLYQNAIASLLPLANAAQTK